MNTQPMQTPPDPLNLEVGPPRFQDPIATVLTARDPEISPGTRVRVTGYTAIVPVINRRTPTSAMNKQIDVTHAFDLGELQFDDHGAAIVLGHIAKRIGAALDRVGWEKERGGNSIPLAECVEDICDAFGEMREEVKKLKLRRGSRINVDKLTPDVLLLPEVWATLLGFEVMDWDGWNDARGPVGPQGEIGGRYLGDPCTRRDFDHRINACTIKNLTNMVRDDDGLDSAIKNYVEADLRQQRPARTAAEAANPNAIKRTGVTPCCGYPIHDIEVGPIFWNEFNRVVQCHNCGQVFTKGLAQQLTETMPVQADGPAPIEQRHRLPDTRNAVTHKFDIAGQKGYITVGFYGEGDDVDPSRPGEVFIVIQKQGSTLQGFADAWARSLSMLLQYGVPVREIARMFAWHKFEPRGITTNPDIRVANSIVDYTARWLGHLCIEDYQPGGEPIAEVPDKPLDATAPPDAR